MDPIPTVDRQPAYGADNDSSSSAAATAAHRRIQLESAQDLLYLKQNAARSAQAKLDLHLPLYATTSATAATTTAAAEPQSSSSSSSQQPEGQQSQAQSSDAPSSGGGSSGSGGKNDRLRKAVEEHVRRYIEETFALATPSVSIAGLDAESLDWAAAAGPDEFEPYDTALAEQIAELHARIELLNGELAQMRRSTVKRAVADWQAAYRHQAAALERAADHQAQQLQLHPRQHIGEQENPVAAAGESPPPPPPPLLLPLLLEGDNMLLGGRSEQVRRTWNAALQELKSLKDGLGETRTRAEEAVAVSSYLSKEQQLPATPTSSAAAAADTMATTSASPGAS